MEDLPKQNLRKRFYTSSHNEGSPSVDESTNKAHKNILEYYVDKYLQNMSHSFKTFFVRLILTAILLILLPLLVFGDFLINFSIILIIVIQCYREYVRVGYTEYRIHKLPLIRSLAYYILFTTIYLLLGEFPITYLVSVLPTNTYIFLITYHKFINFCLFMLGVVAFVLTLKRHYYKIQFSLYGWCLLGAVFLCGSASCLFQNMQVGIIWIILPMSLIIMNDIFAYLAGIIFGKTRLIKISPKKTWEGFIGAGIITPIGGFLLADILTRFPYFYCPYKFTYGLHTFDINCKLPSFMQPQVYQFPVLATLILPERISSFQYYPIYLHALAISIFCSLLAPFGGFFASGFKRAFKIKDFGDTFPGHGGMLDRMDCQFLITIFVYVYINTFIKVAQPQRLFNQILKLSAEDQIEIYEMLKNSLDNFGLL